MSIEEPDLEAKHLFGPLCLVLIALNVGMFLIVAASLRSFNPNAEVLVAWGANFAPLTLTGQVWRLVTNTFIHGGWLHLLANMYMLFFVGRILERMTGSLRFGIIYLVSGAGGSLLSAMWQGHHQTTRLTGIAFGQGIFETGIAPAVSMGASGAVMGLVAALVVQAVRDSNNGEDPLTDVPLGRIIVSTLAIGFFISGVDNAAHIGGLLTGALIARFLYDREWPHSSRMWPVVVAAGFAVLIILSASFSSSDELETLRNQQEHEFESVMKGMQQEGAEALPASTDKERR